MTRKGSWVQVPHGPPSEYAGIPSLKGGIPKLKHPEMGKSVG